MDISSLGDRLLNPIDTAKDETETVGSRVGYVGASIALGLVSAFIPHVIYWHTQRQIIPLNPSQAPKTETGDKISSLVPQKLPLPK